MKILFGSDICFSYMDFPGIGSGKRAFADVKKLFSKADFSFVNLENVFGGKEEFTPIAKGGPNLISFQPMNANFGIIAPFDKKIKGGKKCRNEAYAKRSLELVQEFDIFNSK